MSPVACVGVDVGAVVGVSARDLYVRTYVCMSEMVCVRR